MWCVGIIYTASNIYKNVSQGFTDDQYGAGSEQSGLWIPELSVYRGYSSNISQRESIETPMNNVMFPDVLLCAGEVIWGHQNFFQLSFKIRCIQKCSWKNFIQMLIFQWYINYMDWTLTQHWNQCGIIKEIVCFSAENLQAAAWDLMKNNFKNRCRLCIVWRDLLARNIIAMWVISILLRTVFIWWSEIALWLAEIASPSSLDLKNSKSCFLRLEQNILYFIVSDGPPRTGAVHFQAKSVFCPLGRFDGWDRPRYLSRPCKLQWIDCRRFWSLKYTQRGACLQLQPQAVYDYDKKAKVWLRFQGQNDPRTVFISWRRCPGP